MKKNIKFILFIILAIIALYLTRVNYGDYGKNKYISACILAQKNKSKLDYTENVTMRKCQNVWININ